MDLSTPQIITAVSLIALAYAAIHATLVVLCHRVKTQTRRHDIIAGARHRRNQYLRAVADRAAQVSGEAFEVDIEEDADPGDFNVDIVENEDDAAPARAAA